jgi:hypothetical protein
VATSTRQPVKPPVIQGDYVSLEKYIESRLDALSKGIDAAAIVSSILRDQAAKCPTRDEMKAELRVLNEQVHLLEISKAQLDSKASTTQTNVYMVIALLGLIISIVSLVRSLY